MRKYTVHNNIKVIPPFGTIRPMVGKNRVQSATAFFTHRLASVSKAPESHRASYEEK